MIEAVTTRALPVDRAMRPWRSDGASGSSGLNAAKQGRAHVATAVRLHRPRPRDYASLPFRCCEGDWIQNFSSAMRSHSVTVV